MVNRLGVTLLSTTALVAGITPSASACEEGVPSGNGKGGGIATGRPDAGCVGNADNKNPPGQSRNDRNAGYELDRNFGAGKSNPAHTADEPF